MGLDGAANGRGGPMQVDEFSSIRFGSTPVHYGIRRSARRKTVTVAVDPEDGVLLTAPADVAVTKLDAVVRARAPWILERLRWVDQPEDVAPAREFVSGESFYYLGRTYRLRVATAAGEPVCRMEAGFLVVSPAASDDPAQRAASVRPLLEEWFRLRAVERIPERVAAWRDRVEVSDVGEVLVRAQQKRWASCDARGTLRFNWRLIGAPMRLVDYVVAHELVHLLHADHTPQFWSALGRAMSDYEDRREALRLLGPRLEW